MGFWTMTKLHFSRDITIAWAIADRVFPQYAMEQEERLKYSSVGIFIGGGKRLEVMRNDFRDHYIRTADLIQALLSDISNEDTREKVRELRSLGVPPRVILLFLYRYFQYNEDMHLLNACLDNYIASIKGKWVYARYAITLILGLLVGWFLSYLRKPA